MSTYGKGPSRADWQKHHELLNAGIKGWNALQRLPVILTQEIPWMKDFKLGFCSEADMAEWTSQGWRPLMVKDFGDEGFKNFNESIGLRFNLSDAAGMVKFRENYLMIMDNEYRERLEDVRNQEFEKYYGAVTEQKAYVSPSDPRAEEMSQYAESTMQESRIVHSDDVPEGQIVKGKRGRPPKR